MPYAIPWTEAEAIYSCVECDYETHFYTPFCPHCGAKQPPRVRQQVTGAARPVTRKHDPSEVQAALDEFNGFAVRLWSYRVSHCELELHFYKTGGHRMRLMCAGVDEIQIPTSAWAADLELIARQGEPYDKCTLRDRKLGHFVRCVVVVAYFGFDSSFFGDGICDG